MQVWYGAVVRCDQGSIYVGAGTNIQDHSVISTVPNRDPAYPNDVYIGDNSVVGHNAVVTASTIESNVLIGQGSIVQEGSFVGAGSIVAAGAVVLPGTYIGRNQMFAGNPAKYIRDVTADEIHGTKLVS